jgi:UDP-glucose:(heptosyl)LPS alpha-1,3-glucosyltransferase
MDNSNRKKLFIVRRESGGIGGAEKVAHRFVKAFSKHFDTELIHAGKMINGVRIQGTRGPSWLRCLRFAKSARKFLKKQEGALVLSMERGVPGTIYRAGDGVHKVWMKIKYQNSVKWVFNPLNWILPYLEKISIEQSKCVVPNSSMVKAEMLEHYKISCEKINVIHNGYDPSVYYPLGTKARLKLRSKLGMDNNDLNLLFAGSGWERKGLLLTLKLLSLIRMRKDKVMLWIAGVGNEARFRKISEKLKVALNVKFLGSINNIAEYYQIADALILPTKYDPFSNSCLEAIACGCPTFTSPQNGASEMVGRDQIIDSNDNIVKNNTINRFIDLICCESPKIASINIDQYNLASEINKYVTLITSHID